MRQLIDVQHRKALHRGHFVQIKVVGNYFCARTPRQFHEFVVHVPGLRRILFQNPHFHLRHFLNSLQHF